MARRKSIRTPVRFPRPLSLAAFAVAFVFLAVAPGALANPVVTISAPSGFTADNTPLAAYTVQEVSLDRVICAVDPPLPIVPGVFAGFTPCPASPYSMSPIPDGSHSYFVVAQDTSGNYGYGLKYFSSDATAPTITVTGLSEGQLVANAWPAVSVTTADPGTGVQAATCAYDAAAPLECNDVGFVSTPLSDGPHTLNVLAVDRAGNASSRAIRFTVEVPGRWKPSLAAPKKAKFSIKRGKLRSGKYASTMAAKFAVPGGSSASSCRGKATIKALAKKKKVGVASVKFKKSGASCLASAKVKVAKKYKGKKLSLTLSYATGPISPFTVKGTAKL